jgi:isoamyl acetate esterase
VVQPLVLTIGDSISGGYRPVVRQLLEGRFRVQWQSDNGGTSTNVLAHLGDWGVQPQPDIVHFNAGLHDLAIDTPKTTNRVSLTDYVANLREIVRRLQSETNAKLIWATTTPVIDEWHTRVKKFDRRDADVQMYNNEALRVMTDAGIAIDDLYAVVESAGREKCICHDGVHMTEFGNKLLADAVADAIVRVHDRANAG